MSDSILFDASMLGHLELGRLYKYFVRLQECKNDELKPLFKEICNMLKLEAACRVLFDVPTIGIYETPITSLENISAEYLRNVSTMFYSWAREQSSTPGERELFQQIATGIQAAILSRQHVT